MHPIAFCKRIIAYQIARQKRQSKYFFNTFIWSHIKRVVSAAFRFVVSYPLMTCIYGVFIIGVFTIIGVMQATPRANYVGYASTGEGSSMISWVDEFNTPNNIDQQSLKKTRWYSGRVEMDGIDSYVSSTCINFDDPSRTFPSYIDPRTEYRDLEVVIYFLSDNTHGSIDVSYCDGEIFKSIPLSEFKNGTNVVDISQINQQKARMLGLKLSFQAKIKNSLIAPLTSKPAIDRWAIWGQNPSLARLLLEPVDRKISTGRKLPVQIQVSPLLSDLPTSLLQVSLRHKLVNEDNIDLFHMTPLGKSSRGESAINEIDPDSNQYLVYQLQPIKYGSSASVDVEVFTQEGLDRGDAVFVEASLIFGPRSLDFKADIMGFNGLETGPPSINVTQINYIDDMVFTPSQILYSSSEIEVISSAKLNLLAYDRYSNLAPRADNLWTTFFIEDNGLVREPGRVYADGKDILVVADLAASSCQPVYQGSIVKKLLDNDNFYDLEDDFGRRITYEIISEPEIGKPVSNIFGEEKNRYVVMRVDEWDWESIYYGLVIDYDIKGGNGCEIGSEVKFDARIYTYLEFDKEDLDFTSLSFDDVEDLRTIEEWDRELRAHPIVEERCSLQRFPSRDVIRIDQKTLKPQDAYWPELRISREANCYRKDNYATGIDDASPFGYVAPGEYVLVNYWMNEGYREQTLDNIEWFYVIDEIKEGTSFHGAWLDMSIRNNEGNFYPQRLETKVSDETIEYYKADISARGVLMPDDEEFNHFNPERSGWYKVKTDQVPLLGEADLEDSEAPVYYSEDGRYAVMARVKDLEPAWEKDFFLPTFMTQICDGSFDCQPPEDGAILQLNAMDVYSLADGECEYCGRSQFGTVKVGKKSFPQVILFAEQEVFTPGGEFQFMLNPENLAMASTPVWGQWGFDFGEMKDLIDWDSVSLSVDCDRCELPEECKLSDVMDNSQIDKESGRVTFNLDATQNCFVDTATGYKNLADFCRDAYNQSFRFFVRGSFDNYDIDKTKRVKVKGFVENVDTIAEDLERIHKHGKRELKEIPLKLRP